LSWRRRARFRACCIRVWTCGCAGSSWRSDWPVLVPMYCMRAEFFRLLVVFTLGSFAVSATQFLAARVHPTEALAQESRRPGWGISSIWFSTSHIGLAGLRSEIPECRKARKPT